MIIEIDEILMGCPPKLIELYPVILDKVREWQDTPDSEKKNFVPLILGIKGSRNSGKSQFFSRASIAGSYDGYFKSIMFATMTSSGLEGCIDALEENDPTTRNTGRDTRPATRVLTIKPGCYTDFVFDFFGKFDVKNQQKKFDMLIAEEVEKWNENQGIKALETYIRHSAVIILISNHLPPAVARFIKNHNGIILEVNYDDNPSCPQHIVDAYNKAAKDDPAYFRKFVMCDDAADYREYFNYVAVDNLTQAETNLERPKMRPSAKVLSIDVGSSADGDESVICLLEKISNNIFCRVLWKGHLESYALSAKVAECRSQTAADAEVWDASGVGLPVLQLRAPDPVLRDRMGIYEYRGNDKPAEMRYFNARSNALGRVNERAGDKTLVFLGDVEEKDMLRLEMNAHEFAPDDISNGLQRCEKKEKVKKRLGGRSPNLLDSISMGVYFIDFVFVNSNNDIYGDINEPITVTGVPSL